MSKGINSKVSSMTLVDFAKMVRMTSSGGFATSIKKTSGVIYADKSGTAHNVTLFSIAKGDAAKNRELREQLVSAFDDRHASVQFLAYARKQLGLDPGVAGADASKPLPRHIVKSLLKTFNEGIIRAKNGKGGNRPTTGFQIQALKIDGAEVEGWVDVYDKTDELADTLVERLQSTCPDAQSRLKALKNMCDALELKLRTDDSELMDSKSLRLLAVQIIRTQMAEGATGGFLDDGNVDLVVRSRIGQVMFDELMASTPKNGEEQRRMIKDLSRLLKLHNPGATMNRLEEAMNAVLLKNPLLTISKGSYSHLGHKVRSVILEQFRAGMKNLSDAEKIAYLKNYKFHVQAAAEKANRVLEVVTNKLPDYINKSGVVKMQEVNDRDGQPVDNRSVDLRRKSAVFLMRPHFLTVTMEDLGPGQLDLAQCEEYIDGYSKSSSGKSYVDDSLITSNYNAEVALQTATKIKEMYDFDISDDLCEALVLCAQENALASHEDNKEKPTKIGGYAQKFADIFASLAEACNRDMDKASKLFAKVLAQDVNKSISVDMGLKMLKSIAETDLELPETLTPESLTKFCAGLATKTHKVTQKCLKDIKGEITADDMRSLYGVFTLMLFTLRADAKEWLAKQDEEKLTSAYCVLQNSSNANTQHFQEGVDERNDDNSVQNMNLSRIVETMAFLKQSGD